MASSVGGALAEGIERGMGLGFQIQDRERQAALDKQNAAERERAFGLQQQQYADQQARLARQDERQAALDQQKLLDDEHEELLAQVTGALQAGQPVPVELGQRISANAAARREHRDKILAPRLAQERQRAQDFFSGVQSGTVDVRTVPGRELYRYMSLATGRTPEQILDAANGAQMAVQGKQTNNKGLMLRGVNKMMAAELRAGIGAPSPHGGVIVGKEIEDLLPAQDAEGNVHPDKVIPVLRVYVHNPELTGPVMQNGANGYYLAPVTEGRGTGPDEMTKAIDLAHAFDYAGQLGSLAALLQDPQLRARLEEGAKEVGAQTKADVDAMTALGRARLKPEDRLYAELTDEERKAAARVKAGLDPKAKEAPAGVQRDQARLDEIREMVAEGKLPPDVGRRMELSLLSGAHSGLGMSYIDTGRLPEKVGKGAKGAKGAGTGGGTPSTKYDNNEAYRAAVHHWAEVVAAGGKMPPGTGRDKEFIRDVNLVVPQYSGGAREQIANAAEVAGGLAGARAVGARAANFELAKSEAYKMADLVTQASALANRTRFSDVNVAINAWEKRTGDTAVRDFGAALNSFINAYARAVSPIGSPTVHDKKHAREMLSTADSHAQVVSIIAQLKKEMVAAGEAPAEVRAKQREAALGGLQTTGPAGRAPGLGGASRAPQAPAPGTVDGGYRFKGGNPADKANWEKVQ